VALPDERKEFPGASEIHLGGGKDLLYGWLVGRAAADLGLAQALAASEAQRNEQIKRLEESLLGQIRELRESESSNDGKGSAEIDALKVDLQRVSESQQQSAADRIHVEQLEAAIRGKLHEFESRIQQPSRSGAGSDLGDLQFELNLLVDRIARAEYSVQQAQAQAASQSQRVEEIVADRLKTETALLRTQLVAELDSHTPAATLAQSVEAVEASWQNQLDELRVEIGQGTRAANAVDALNDNLAQLSQRLGQIESAPSVTASLAEQESRWTRAVDGRMARLEQTALTGTADLKAEIDEIKTRLNESTTAAPSDDLAVKKLEESIFIRFGELQEQLTTALSVVNQRDAEIRGLAAQLSMISDKLADFSNRSEDYAARTGALESRLGERLEAGERSAADLGQLQIDMSTLLNQMTQIELAYQQAQASSGAEAQRGQQVAEGLLAELAALKAELGQQAMVTAQSILANVEEIFGTKIDELQRCLLRAQQDGDGRDARLSEMQGELRVIAQRLVQAESSTQQTHALLVNETVQSAQLRDGMMGEIAALQSQLAEQRASGTSIDSLGRELSARLENLQNQLSQNIATLESRDAEIAALKTQVQNIAQSATVLKSATPAPTVNRLQAPIGVTVGLGGVKGQSETMMPALKSAAGEDNSLLQTYDTEADGPKEQKRQLQQRISADIERVRAELRKRAGVNR
jgi:DNA repair exonuclease SbcCD ATPase subunit